MTRRGSSAAGGVVGLKVGTGNRMPHDETGVITSIQYQSFRRAVER